jgi:ribulose-5-phosphate 4-epimerase/fuculose-1-phosphate aldolase
MNPLGKHFGLMTAGDLICLDVNSGKVVGGNKSRTANSAGFFIHSEIHKARPDVHAVCHAHTNAGRAWSSFATGLDMLNQDICYLYNAIAVYAAYGGIVFAEEEGKNIARSLGEKNKVRLHQPKGLRVRICTEKQIGCNPPQPRPSLHRQHSRRSWLLVRPSRSRLCHPNPG